MKRNRTTDSGRDSRAAKIREKLGKPGTRPSNDAGIPMDYYVDHKPPQKVKPVTLPRLKFME